MTEPLELGLALVSAVFGAGVAWATLRGSVSAARAESAAANAAALDALGRIAAEKNRSSEQDKTIALNAKEAAYLRRDVDELRALFKPRLDSDRGMPAARQPPRPDVPRQDSDPVPPMRGRLGSRRDG